MDCFALKGNILYTPRKKDLQVLPNAYVICRDGLCQGGGSFFGKVGSFESEYEFDAVVLDNSRVPYPGKLSLAERLERAVYLGLDRIGILAKYVRGRPVEGFPLTF